MTFDKAIVHELQQPYAIDVMGPGPEPSVACVSEGHGPMVRIDPPYQAARPLAPGPGGCMSMAFDPARPSELYVVMGCFPGFDHVRGGIHRLRAGGALEPVVSLPYVHRLGFVRRGEARVLLAATLAGAKKDPADWSSPGSVYAIDVDRPPAAGAAPAPVLTGLHKNHGFHLNTFDGRRSLLLGASEGLLAVDLEAPEWAARQLLPGETSEVAAFDLDGDGRQELVTIEPFHGHALRAYRRSAGRWEVFFEAELEFGHCVTAGVFHGRRSVLVSSRAGRKDLLLFQFEPDAPLKPRRVVVDEGVGAANMLFARAGGRDLILSANQVAGQVVRYAPRD